MEIISHRGYWKTIAEKNQPVAFERSFSLGFGTETDFRDYLGEVVIAHDIATPLNITAQQCFGIYNQHICKRILALNIKADGLQQKLKSLLEEYSIENYFVFDMSIPDTIGYMKKGIKFFSRQSEYEPIPAFYKECDGIWLDAFIDTWYDMGLIKEHIENCKKVAIVSPDLHNRDVFSLWEKLKEAEIDKLDGVILCTDIPEKAKAYFK
ncbi:hypothetical protein [Parasediminibacterium sp. JCM 36343]|uniref:hypothetical protein n=1 Tax=Parasediminibacterium sp. JCM 36343 TaxID=3374279 RepID=UPI00397DD6CE